MADRENVINELNECIEHIRENKFDKIPFWGNCQSAMMDALELLKEQQPKTGHWQDKYEGIATCSARCSRCEKVSSGFATDNGFSFDYRYHEYCPKCGAKMDNAKEE